MIHSEEILQALSEHGYYIIPDYFTTEQCHKLKDVVDKYMQKYTEKVQRDYKEGLGGDYRLFGLENIDQDIHDSLFNLEYLDILRTHGQNPNMSSCTVMAGVVRACNNENNSSYRPNSGGGWHRDPGTQYGTKTKTIIYLSDVTTLNGPFTIIPGSKVSDVGVGIVRTDTEKVHQGLRICDEFVEELTIKGKPPVELTGKAGTLILVDVGNIHMGKPIEEGSRYSLTNYFQLDQKATNGFLARNAKHYISATDKLEKN